MVAGWESWAACDLGEKVTAAVTFSPLPAACHLPIPMSSTSTCSLPASCLFSASWLALYITYLSGKHIPLPGLSENERLMSSEEKRGGGEGRRREGRRAGRKEGVAS